MRSRPSETAAQKKKRLAADRKRHKALYAERKAARLELEKIAEAEEYAKQRLAKKEKRELTYLAKRQHKKEVNAKIRAIKYNKSITGETAEDEEISMPVQSLLPALLHGKIDLPKAANLRAEGHKYVEIAAIFGVTEGAMKQALSRYTNAAREVDMFRNSRADILAELQKILLNSIDLQTIEKADLAKRVSAIARLYEIERLEQDKSTANIAMLHDTVAKLKADKPEADMSEED